MADLERIRQDSPKFPRGGEDELIFPSTEWAWMMGVLAVGGSITRQNKTRAISITNPQEDLGKVIKSRGERLLGVNAHTYLRRGHKSPTIVFNSMRYVEALGDFTRDGWVTTVSDQHGWILKDERYAWSFLEGIFEIRGSFYRKPPKTFDLILIRIGYRNGANFLTDLLVRVGLENPSLRINKLHSEGIAGVKITAKKDLRHFAEHVHSVVPQVEERLAFYRGLNVRYAGDSENTPEEIIEEWQRVTLLLGHDPTYNELTKLRSNKQTKYGPKIYIGKFGMTDQGVSFSAAKRNLIVLMSTDDNNPEATSHALKKGRPRKFSDEEVILEWVRIKRVLGHIQSYDDLRKLRVEGKTNISPQVYAKRFGDGSWARAREVLEKLTQERMIASAGSES